MIEALQPLIGEWNVTTSLGPADARTTFENTLDGAFVLERSTIDVPGAPDSHCLIAANADGSFTQHYFDSRGVARVYAMTFEHGVWTLTREQPDFSDFNFAQRYVGRFDGDVITGAWEIKHPGTDWAKDFDLNYERV